MDFKDTNYIMSTVSLFCKEKTNLELYELSSWFNLGSIVNLEPPKIVEELIFSKIGEDIFSQWEKENRVGIHSEMFNIVRHHLLVIVLGRFKEVI